MGLGGTFSPPFAIFLEHLLILFRSALQAKMQVSRRKFFL